MANTAVASRFQLLYGLCLPLAVIVGYLLAQPFELSSIAVVFLLLGILVIPVLMRWHHALLILCINANVVPFFIPGRPNPWMAAGLMSFFFLILDRSMGQKVNFFKSKQVSYSLIFLTAVMVGTGYLTGGLSFYAVGGSNGGGRRYAEVVAAIMVYFGLSAIPIGLKYARIAIIAFFGAHMIGLIGYVAYFAYPNSDFFGSLFPTFSLVDEGSESTFGFGDGGFARYGCLGYAGLGLFCLLFCLYGIRGSFRIGKPLRLVVLLVALVATLFSGFRSNLILFILTFAFLFYLESLFKTRYFFILSLFGMLCFGLMIPYAQKLPLTVQRTLCFLPINFDLSVQATADDSTEWRLDMWREVVHTIPQYLFIGKGYEVPLNEMYLVSQAMSRGYYGKRYELALLAGDYHSGPLSVIIPFGIFGSIAFLWFLGAGLYVLYRNHKYGVPELWNINSFLLAFFAARILFFMFIFGSLYSDFIYFTALVGLSVSLNGGVASPRRKVQRYEEEN